ncbi:MAG: ABC transporter ATP-binding protein, partial [Thaumarchaeota archaeon]|nr:ABC transporter ATP-binding protein [Candidatus Calditenuaceae archaeon]MDW8187645.1 ABC transporter ATP-binding protein [Nitrososphaerota archaeon]
MLEVVDYAVRAYGHGVEVKELRVSSTTALLGRNGSGKTILARSLLGFLRPERGRVLIEGEEVTELPPELRPIGYLPQHQVSLPMKPLSQLQYVARLHGSDWNWVVERLGLRRVIGKEGLSGGERQLLNLATVLLKRPRALVLDEPTSHLDFANKLLVLEALRSIDVPTLFITHDPLEASFLSDEIVTLRDGKVSAPVRNSMKGWAID